MPRLKQNTKKICFLLLLLPICYLLFIFNFVPKNDKKVARDITLKSGPRIFCIILTQHKNLETKAKATYDTWAHKCDNHSYITQIHVTHKSEARAEFQIVNKSLIVLKPEKLHVENYQKLTDKVYAAYEDVYLHHPHYDWYLKCDDDTFIFVDNLRMFLSDKNLHAPVSFGYHYENAKEGEFLSGGAGYVMSREAFTRLGKQLHQNASFCPNNGKEDVNTLNCLKLLGAEIGNSLDEQGRQRFHPFPFGDHWRGFAPDHWIHSFSVQPLRNVSWNFGLFY